jgi:hypothetical protein
MAFMAKEGEHAEKEVMSANTWLGDSAASCHLCNDDDGMFDWKHINLPVKIGNGKALMATKIDKLKRTIIQKDGKTVDVILTEVKYVPDLWINLFSIGKALKNGFNIGNKGIMIYLTEGVKKILFDKIMTTNKGFVMGVDMHPSTSQQTIAVPMME